MVPVLYEEGQPIAIVYHRGRQTRFRPSAPAAVGILERLVIRTDENDGTLGLFLESHHGATRLPVEDLGVTLTSAFKVRWGERDNRFLLWDTSDYQDNVFYVFALDREELDASATASPPTLSLLGTYREQGSTIPFLTVNYVTSYEFKRYIPIIKYTLTWDGTFYHQSSGEVEGVRVSGGPSQGIPGPAQVTYGYPDAVNARDADIWFEVLDAYLDLRDHLLMLVQVFLGAVWRPVGGRDQVSVDGIVDSTFVSIDVPVNSMHSFRSYTYHLLLIDLTDRQLLMSTLHNAVTLKSHRRVVQIIEAGHDSYVGGGPQDGEVYYWVALHPCFYSFDNTADFSRIHVGWATSPRTQRGSVGIGDVGVVEQVEFSSAFSPWDRPDEWVARSVDVSSPYEATFRGQPVYAYWASSSFDIAVQFSGTHRMFVRQWKRSLLYRAAVCLQLDPEPVFLLVVEQRSEGQLFPECASPASGTTWAVGKRPPDLPDIGFTKYAYYRWSKSAGLQQLTDFTHPMASRLDEFYLLTGHHKAALLIWRQRPFPPPPDHPLLLVDVADGTEFLFGRLPSTDLFVGIQRTRRSWQMLRPWFLLNPHDPDKFGFHNFDLSQTGYDPVGETSISDEALTSLSGVEQAWEYSINPITLEENFVDEAFHVINDPEVIEDPYFLAFDRQK